MLKRAWILGLFALGLGVGAFAQQAGQQDAAAAKALARQDFPAVVKIYAAEDSAQLSDKALYRLAIAQFRLGNRTQAATSLDRALKLNPEGTFASSPERLEQWVTAIGPVVPESKPEAVSSPATPSVPPAASPQPVTAASDTRLPALAAMPIAPAASNPAITGLKPDRLRGFERNSGWILLGCCLALGVLAILIYFTFPGPALDARRKRREHRRLFERLQEFRAEAGSLHHSIESAGRMDSDLYSSLSGLLRALDGEIGRAYYHGTGREQLLVPADAATLEVIDLLRQGPMKLSQSTGEQVKALFQTSQRTL